MEEPLRDDVPGRGMLIDTVESGGRAGGADPRAVRDVDVGGMSGIVIALGGVPRVPVASGGDGSDGDGEDGGASDTRPLLSSLHSRSFSSSSLGEKSITFSGSVVLTINNISGAGMLTLPMVFQPQKPSI